MLSQRAHWLWSIAVNREPDPANSAVKFTVELLRRQQRHRTKRGEIRESITKQRHSDAVRPKCNCADVVAERVRHKFICTVISSLALMINNDPPTQFCLKGETYSSWKITLFWSRKNMTSNGIAFLSSFSMEVDEIEFVTRVLLIQYVESQSILYVIQMVSYEMVQFWSTQR